MKSAFFLDRDGVINAEVDYLSDPEQAVLLPGVADALKMIHASGMLAVVVTNQSGIARGYYTEEDMHAVHRRLDELLAQSGAAVDAYYFCPHHPKYTGECDCRKPAPGMLKKAAAELHIDIASSAMAGDRMSDVGAGRTAGCAESYLLLTGYGPTTAATHDLTGITVKPDLASAVRDFLDRFQVK
ncbi:MAG: D-glycero-beta-D-manno-heptose 1,7-bisphosphate 7-phosphatase [Victivallaceae bacterium]|nr:D-glycero-beta-D-manno-heptose 1,7-bisphosphate 7-phosphatase [Victivallaceae bacterium]